MFGYVKPFKPLLRVCEFDTYQAVYCGLCKQLSRSYGPFARFTLSYDFTFLALLDTALKQSPPSFHREGCITNPLRKKLCCVPSDSLEFSASMAMLMFYYKVADDVLDEPYPKKIIYKILLSYATHIKKRIPNKYNTMDSLIAEQMKIQADLEQNNCGNVDEAGEPTANCLSVLLENRADTDSQKRILNRLGYLLGRWIYLADALDDIEQDRTKKRYNPFLSNQAKGAALEVLKQDAVLSLNLTIAELEKTFNLLKLYRYQPILDNIITLGLKNTVDLLATGKSPQKNKSRNRIR